MHWSLKLASIGFNTIKPERLIWSQLLQVAGEEGATNLLVIWCTFDEEDGDGDGDGDDENGDNQDKDNDDD